jgi:hypothetical protein
MFDAFWQSYPRRVARRAAEKAWSKLSDDEKSAALAAIQDHARYWRLTDRAQEVIPHAATWLNQARWEDELPAVAKPARHNGIVGELTGNVYGLRRVG